MRRFVIFLAAALLLGGLIATNPGMDAFATFVGEQSERILRNETGDTPLGRMIAGAGAGLASSYVDRVKLSALQHVHTRPQRHPE